MWETIVWRCVIGGDKMGLCMKTKYIFHGWRKCCWRNPKPHLGLFFMTYCQRCPYRRINLYFALAFDDANNNLRNHSLVSNLSTYWWKQQITECASACWSCKGMVGRQVLVERSASEMFSSDGSVRQAGKKNCMPQEALTEFLKGNKVSSGKTGWKCPNPWL